jgi:hypothetical protein
VYLNKTVQNTELYHRHITCSFLIQVNYHGQSLLTKRNIVHCNPVSLQHNQTYMIAVKCTFMSMALKFIKAFVASKISHTLGRKASDISYFGYQHVWISIFLNSKVELSWKHIESLPFVSQWDVILLEICMLKLYTEMFFYSTLHNILERFFYYIQLTHNRMSYT